METKSKNLIITNMQKVRNLGKKEKNRKEKKSKYKKEKNT